MHRTKVKYENKQRAITKKKKQTRVMVHVHCSSPLMRSIHPQNFITLASIVLEICSRQNSSMKKKTKGNHSNIKQARVTVHVHCAPKISLP